VQGGGVNPWARVLCSAVAFRTALQGEWSLFSELALTCAVIFLTPLVWEGSKRRSLNQVTVEMLDMSLLSLTSAC